MDKKKRPNPERDKIVQAARKLADPEKWNRQHREAVARYRKTHREEMNRKSRERYKNNPKLVASQQKAWAQRNKPARARMMRDWNVKHPGYYREYWKKYRAENKDRIREYNRKSKALRRGAGGADLGVILIIKKWKLEASFQCTYCELVFNISKLHVDHIIPVSRGGRHSMDNICKSCPKCNLKKSSKTPEEFAACR